MSSNSSEKEWIGISDLMSVLMMVFLFIAILFMLQVQQDHKALQRQHEAMAAVAKSYDESQHALHDELTAAFHGKLARWNGEILANGTMRFNHPKGMFRVGSSELGDDFKKNLADFFPRYLAVMSSPRWRDDISEIRVVGHTSSDWDGGGIIDDEQARYLHNAKLSQARAHAVLEHLYQLPLDESQHTWLRQVLRATGASYAEPILVDGVEDKEKSRRVEFQAIRRADKKLYDILNNL